jgi:hypothetical protein
MKSNALVDGKTYTQLAIITWLIIAVGVNIVGIPLLPAFSFSAIGIGLAAIIGLLLP